MLRVQSLDDIVKMNLVFEIQVNRGFVQQKNLGILGQRTGQDNALPLAATELCEWFLREIQCAGKPHRRLGTLQVRAVVEQTGKAGRLMWSASHQDHLAHGKRKHDVRFLGNKSHAARQDLRRYFLERDTIELHGARVSANQAGEYFQERGFPCAVRTDERHKIADFNGHGNAVQHGRPGIGKFQVGNSIHGGIVYWQPVIRGLNMFKKILIANRGEIAVRVMRTCADMGIATVAVYSEADRGALHVRMADEAVFIGPSPSSESYLVTEKIIHAAQQTGADAVHPGYGFLSENASFAQACADAGLTFIGPSPRAIALMGSKVESRRAASQFLVPMVPGTVNPVENEDEARKIAATVGYPIMLKASAGGGGKGMRLVQSDAELAGALANTRAEAKAAFGDDAVYIEKFVDRPRHIEIQVLADQHGNAVYLGERECTIQRRHQKVIEECPSPIMTADLRERMGKAALDVVRAAEYTNAGTVEFLVDRERRFYFLEMNTRLQVEHPVTEMVTGLDLVREQIRIAMGEKLAFTQSDVRMNGSALECRVYAEDPENNFFPSPGTIQILRTPAGPGIRDDSGVFEGWTVPIDYDPLISKLVAWAPTRQEAIERMQRALREYRVEGIQTNLGFFREILNDSDFRKGEFDTGFIDQWLKRRGASTPPSPVERDFAAIAAILFETGRASAGPLPNDAANPSRWKTAGRKEGLRTR